ncbi:MAG TPA: HYR domain-containing protein, partial [Planctomycetota bacterium]|nr:HYR domain-containing protein [Planctomycetota bacterium]
GTGAALPLGSNPSTALSADGRFVAFADAVGNGDVYRRDLAQGTTALVSRSMLGISGGNGESFAPAISADGRKVAFLSNADDLVQGDTSHSTDVFVADMVLGGLKAASRTPAFVLAGNTPPDSEPFLSPGGEVVAFVSLAGALSLPAVPDGIPMVYAFRMAPTGVVGTPTAAIAPIGPVEVGTSAHLDGSASSDPSGLPLHYLWTWNNTTIGTDAVIDYPLPLGSQEVVLTVTSSATGLSASTTITVVVQDTTPPVISNVADVTLELTSPAGATFTFAPAVSDNSGIAPTLTSNVLPVYPLHNTLVTFVAEDAAHNVSSVTVTVRVIDSTRPTFTSIPLPPILEQTQRDGTPYVVQLPLAEDASTLTQLVTSDAPETFPLGKTPVTFMAVDSSGNTASMQIFVTVMDTKAPVFTFVPDNITVQMTDPAGTPVTIQSPTASDICDANPIITSDAPALFLVGTRVVHFTAMDKSGNKAETSITVTVVDSTPPNTTILSGPSTPTTSTTATFTFASTEAGSTFLRSLDSGPAVLVQSPETLSGLASGQHVYQVRAVDAAGNPDPTPAVFTWMVDSTPPVQGSVRDGGTVDVSYQTSTTSISAAWFNFSDSETGISSYEWAIGTTPLGTNVQPFVGVGSATTATATGLTLVPANVYYVSVRATNGVGLTCAPVSSNGVAIETSAPTQGTVNDGSGADIAFQTSTTSLSANWTGFSDPQSGIAGYEWAIGTTSGGTDVQPYTGVGVATSATKSLVLVNGQKYYVTVRATNGIGMQSTATSNGVTVDSSAPSAGSVRDGGDKDVDWQSSLTTITASWTASTDPQSGIVGYEWAIGTTSGGTNVQSFTSVGTSKSATNSSLALTAQQKYYVTVRTTNGAGQTTTVSSNGVTVDPSAPVAGTVSISISPSGQVTGSWTAFSDPQSGLATLEWAVGTAAGLSDTLAFTSVKVTDTSAKKNNLTLTAGKKYYVTVRATNAAGGVTTASSSSATAP